MIVINSLSNIQYLILVSDYIYISTFCILKHILASGHHINSTPCNWQLHNKIDLWPYHVTLGRTEYSPVPLKRGRVYHDITYSNAMATAEHKSDIELPEDIPYLALTGELLGVFSEDLGENWPRYKGTARDIYEIVQSGNELASRNELWFCTQKNCYHLMLCSYIWSHHSNHQISSLSNYLK